jgi:ubiquinone/menaquinone biosynthesis C-methylase UbiE
MNRLTFEQLGISGQERVLEVGFGGGDLIEWILSATEAKAIGVEASEAMLKRARGRFRRELGQGRLRLEQGLADALPLPGGSVDKACSVNSLYFWPDLEAALAEFARVLRPGGRFVLCFQAPESVLAWPGHIHGFRAYGADEVAALMEAAGFGQVRQASGEAPAVGQFMCLSSERGNE